MGGYNIPPIKSIFEMIPMTFLPWFLVALLALLCGAFYMLYLVSQPQRMSLWLALALGGTFAVLACTGAAPNASQRLGLGLLALACLAAGYLAATRIFLAQTEPRRLPPLTRAPGAPGDGHTAVIYLTHGEPQAYSYMPWIETFHELDGDRVSFIPWPARPFFLFKLRNEYLEAGGSFHNRQHQQMLHSLVEALPEAAASGTRFYLSFLDSDPRPDEAAIQALNEGASRLVLLHVFITQSSHTQAGEAMLAAVGPEKFGVPVCIAGPLWDSETLQQGFVSIAEAQRGDLDPGQVGILLVGHGQPDDWDAIYPTQTEQETLYRQGIRQRLAVAGYRPENISLAWMEFKKPGVTEAAAALAKNGVRRMLVFSCSISADSLHSAIEVPAMVAAAHLPAEIEVRNLGAWGSYPPAIQALREAALRCALAD